MDALPLKAFLDMLTQGVRRPRPVVRRVIDARPDTAQRLTLVALGAVMQAMVWLLAGLVTPGGASGQGLGGVVVLVAFSFVNYAVTASVAYSIGRRFGGKGAPQDVAAAVAWHTVLAAALSPLSMLALGGDSDASTVTGGGVLFLLLYAGLNVWLLASCIAEAHRFASTGKVVAATLGLFVALGFAMSLMLTLFLSGAPQ